MLGSRHTLSAVLESRKRAAKAHLSAGFDNAPRHGVAVRADALRVRPGGTELFLRHQLAVPSVTQVVAASRDI